MNRTTIEWTDYTWNPVTGCNKVSAGCRSCYAETMANRFWGDRKFTDVQMHEERLYEPGQNEKKWRGKKVFVCSMSDLFHEAVTSNFIYDVLETIHNFPDTIFQIPTKRPERALEIFTGLPEARLIEVPGNLWLGVSCEDQQQADNRIPILLQIPAAVRFLSCEPLLGPITLPTAYCQLPAGTTWVIAGGESGHHARPMHPEWVRSLRDQCAQANVPFFFKQWGAWMPEYSVKAHIVTPKGQHAALKHVGPNDIINSANANMVRVGKSRSGNTLDGKQHLAFPTLPTAPCQLPTTDSNL